MLTHSLNPHHSFSVSSVASVSTAPKPILLASFLIPFDPFLILSHPVSSLSSLLTPLIPSRHPSHHQAHTTSTSHKQLDRSLAGVIDVLRAACADVSTLIRKEALSLLSRLLALRPAHEPLQHVCILHHLSFHLLFFGCL